MSVFFFSFHSFIFYPLCHVEFKKRALIPIQCSLPAPHETKVCDDITQLSQWVIHRDSSWDVLFKLRLSPQIQLAAKLCHFLTILLLHFHPFSSFHMCFSLVAVCVFGKKCCKMQIPFWSITVNCIRFLAVCLWAS